MYFIHIGKYYINLDQVSLVVDNGETYTVAFMNLDGRRETSEVSHISAEGKALRRALQAHLS